MKHDESRRPLAPQILDTRGEGDESLARLLRAAVPTETPAWEALHARVVMSGAPALDRRRSRRDEIEWWELAARWSRAALPLAVAASALFILSLSRQRETGASAIPTVRSALESVVASSEGDTDLLHALLGSSGQGWTVRGAYDRE